MKVKHPPTVSRRWRLWGWFDIPSRRYPGEVYLRRLSIIQTPWCSVLFHKIYEPDDGYYPHDHPWAWFRTFILRGGYLADEYQDYESFLNDQVNHRIHRTWSSYKMTFLNAHQIMLVRPNTWTLVITGRRIRTFCFWDTSRKNSLQQNEA